MKKDIKNRIDIELLVDTFYGKVRNDKVIGHFFDGAIHINWERHLPSMYNFLENILFFTGNYEGNPLNLHQHLNKITNIDKKHFNRWIKLFFQSVDELFEGEKAELIKKRAANIGDLMQKNIFNH